MTSRERLKTVLAGGIPDCVPASPDISNMIPCRLTGRPFWDIYLHSNPPLYDAYIAAVKHFDIDAFMDITPLVFPDEPQGMRHIDGTAITPAIVERTDDRIVVQWQYQENGKKVWTDWATVYYRSNPPAGGVPLTKLGLPRNPPKYEPFELPKYDDGPNGFKRIKRLMGDQGLVGATLTGSCIIYSEEGIYDYFDHPEKYELMAQQRVDEVEKRFARIMSMAVEDRPDFLSVGGSGTLIFQTPELFRKIAYPAVKRGIELATAAGIPTHVHSCGPETPLVKIFAEETTLTVIDPLEIPPMGDCDLGELKRLYGSRLVLKGNLHTTETMLRGSVQDVIRESKKCIDQAAKGGRFILSTGDQCGRDTPDDNLRAMIDTARTYGKY